MGRVEEKEGYSRSERYYYPLPTMLEIKLKYEQSYSVTINLIYDP